MEELKDEKIKFLFISSKKDSDEAIKATLEKYGVEGENVRISQQDWTYLSIMFNISGIPHKALINKKGEVVHNNPLTVNKETLMKLINE